ncbi:hypothetical protein [Peribacillus asahii]|uniref:hypothetical protein n=1 Tax=Peribacillus asahii TaxID=228899 RepID=UPI00115E2C89|nr:hypothetical protein [Peribacillus asahii]
MRRREKVLHEADEGRFAYGKGRKKAFMKQMKTIWRVEKQGKGLHNPDEGPFACGKAGKRPS